MVVEARDQGSPSLTGTTTATVTLTDVNDNAPVFTNTPFSFTVDENAANDTEVGTVTAVDYDTGMPLFNIINFFTNLLLLCD